MVQDVDQVPMQWGSMGSPLTRLTVKAEGSQNFLREYNET